jgi:hypothetical protein
MRWAHIRVGNAFSTDFDQMWMAAKVLIAGGNPYSEIGPGKPYQWDWPFYYPLPAALLGIPFAGMTLPSARIAFAAISAFVMTFALGGARRPYPFTALLSGAFLQAIQHLQVAPLVLAAMLWPALGGIAAVKPNVGIAALVGADQWRNVRLGVVGAVIVCAAFLLVRPSWPLEWLRIVRSAVQTVPMMLRAGGLGLVLLLAALKWRRPEARTLLALSVIPATPGAMEPLLFYAFPMSFRAQLTLGLLTHIPPIVMSLYIARNGPLAPLVYLDVLGLTMLLVVYLPVLAYVLRLPNAVADS